MEFLGVNTIKYWANNFIQLDDTERCMQLSNNNVHTSILDENGSPIHGLLLITLLLSQ